jgi:hypothetical protein
MHKYFAIDQIGQDTWFQPIEEFIGRPKLVCDRSGRWHENSNEKKDYRSKASRFRAQIISAAIPGKAKLQLPSIRSEVGARGFEQGPGGGNVSGQSREGVCQP